MTNSVHLNRALAIICVLLLTACANPPKQVNNPQSNETGPAHYCFAENKFTKTMYFTELFFGEIQLISVSNDFQKYIGQQLKDKSVPTKCKSFGEKGAPIERSLANKLWQLEINKNRGSHKIKVLDWKPQTQSSSANKAIDIQSKVVNNMVQVTVLDGFKVSSGPKELDTKQGEIEQALFTVFDEPNQLVCQVAARLFAKEETRATAIGKFRIKSKTATTDSTKSLASGAEQSIYRVMQSSGVELTFYERAYFFEANESIYNSPFGYRIFCGTETKLWADNRPKIDEFFSLIQWL